VMIATPSCPTSIVVLGAILKIEAKLTQCLFGVLQSADPRHHRTSALSSNCSDPTLAWLTWHTCSNVTCHVALDWMYLLGRGWGRSSGRMKQTGTSAHTSHTVVTKTHRARGRTRIFFTITRWGFPVVDLVSNGGQIGVKQVWLGVFLHRTGL